MATDSFFALLCAGLIAMLFGLAVCFVGYRFFIILLPIWGFFFGLAFGAQTMQALFGTGAFATVTSWVVGFIVGGVFAVLSYLFYAVAVAVIAGSLGYALTVGLLTGIGMNMNFIVWVIGMAVAIALIFVTFRFNLQKWVIVVATAVLGAATIAGTIGLMFNPAASMLENPVKAVLATSPLLAILAIVLAIAGIVVQARSTSMYAVESYNRWDETAV
jgi:Domain of unknown function (DUF4203)